MKTRKILAVLLALTMVFALAACGSAGSAPAKTESAPTEAPAKTEAAPTEAPAAAPTEAPAEAPASDFPKKNITIYLGNKAGSTVDIVVRTATNIITQQHPEYNFIIENRPGGSGDLGYQEMMLQPVDGYCLMAGSNTNFSGTIIKDMCYTIDDLKPIACMSGDYGCFIVPADSPFETMDDLIQAAKEGEVSLSTSSISTIHSVYAHVLADMAGLNFNFIYNDGSADSVMMVASGDAQCGTAPFPNIKAMYEEGLIRILCQVSPERLPHIPADVPTIGECGYEIDYGAHRSLWAPKDIPDDAYNALVAVCEEVFNTQEYKDAMNAAGAVPKYMAPDELLAAAQRDIEYATTYYDLLVG